MRFMKDEALDAQVVRSLGKVAMGAGDVTGLGQELVTRLQKLYPNGEHA